MENSRGVVKGRLRVQDPSLALVSHQGSALVQPLPFPVSSPFLLSPSLLPLGAGSRHAARC